MTCLPHSGISLRIRLAVNQRLILMFVSLKTLNLLFVCCVLNLPVKVLCRLLQALCLATYSKFFCSLCFLSLS